MFSPNSFEILSRAEHMHQQELLHEAEEWRRIKESGYQSPSIFKLAEWWVGSTLIGLGERLAPEDQLQPSRRLTYRRI